jgi:hypothetical protein
LFRSYILLLLNMSIIPFWNKLLDLVAFIDYNNLGYLIY